MAKKMRMECRCAPSVFMWGEWGLLFSLLSVGWEVEGMGGHVSNILSHGIKSGVHVYGYIIGDLVLSW